jgi:hypothetical protein
MNARINGLTSTIIFLLFLSVAISPSSLAGKTELLFYDDGIAESSYAPTLSLYTYAVRFHPPTSSSYQVTKARYYIFNDPMPFNLEIRDKFTQLLYSETVTPTTTGWFVVDLTSHQISVQDDFWVAMRYLTLHKPGLGADTTNPHGESAEGESGVPSSPNISSLDWMIRATVSTGITYYPLCLRSRQDNSTTETNLGQIKFDDAGYSLPKDVSTEGGGHTIEYVAGPRHSFVGWETSSGVSVSNSTANPTSMTVSSPGGTLEAVYKTAPPTAYTVHLDSVQDNSATSNLGTMTFDGVPYSLASDVSKEAGSYSASYSAAVGYLFDNWYTTGGIDVSDIHAIFTMVTVSSPGGTLEAVYRNSTQNSEVFEMELFYDDESAESSGAPGSDLCTYAVRFHAYPTSETYRLTKVRYYVYSSPESFELEIWNTQAQISHSETVRPTGTGWFSVDLTSEQISVQGDLWIGIKYLTLNAPRLGADTTNPNSESAESSSGLPSSPNISSLDWMIRASVAEYVEVKPLAYYGVGLNGGMAEYERRIGETGLLIEDPCLQMWVPKRYEEHSRLIFSYFKVGYMALREIFGGHDMPVKFSVEQYPEGPYAWGGTDAAGTIRYGYGNLIDDTTEWNQYHVPHVIGYYEEMAHCFARDFGLRDDCGSVGFYETLGLMIAGRTALIAAWNPYVESGNKYTYQICAETTAYYLDHDTGPPGVTPNIYLTRILVNIFKKEFVDPYGWEALTNTFSLIAQAGYPLGRIAEQKYAADQTWGAFLYYLGKATGLQNLVHSKFKDYGLPLLSWTSEPGFESDGCEPIGGNQYLFRVKAFDREGTEPAEVRLHLYNAGSVNSIYGMSVAGGDSLNGWIYELRVQIDNPSKCKYAFSANDGVHIIFEAVGEPTQQLLEIERSSFSSDLNGDGTVNILDISLVAKAYSSKQGDTSWNEIADLNNDGMINILDISLVARDYGKTV